jgi:hypothetical protein
MSISKAVIRFSSYLCCTEISIKPYSACLTNFAIASKAFKDSRKMDLGALAWVERSNKIMVEKESNIPAFNKKAREPTLLSTLFLPEWRKPATGILRKLEKAVKVLVIIVSAVISSSVGTLKPVGQMSFLLLVGRMVVIFTSTVAELVSIAMIVPSALVFVALGIK